MSQSNLNKEGLSAVGSNADLWAMSASQKKKKRDHLKHFEKKMS